MHTMHHLRFLLATAILLVSASASQAQMIQDPATWTYEVRKTGDNKYRLIFHLSLKKDWHIWSLKPGGDEASIIPSFSVNKTAGVKLIGTIQEKGKLQSKVFIEGDPKFNFFEGKVDYTQDVMVAGSVKIAGVSEYQVCNHTVCLPPKRKPFEFRIP